MKKMFFVISLLTVIVCSSCDEFCLRENEELPAAQIENQVSEKKPDAKHHTGMVTANIKNQISEKKSAAKTKVVWRTKTFGTHGSKTFVMFKDGTKVDFYSSRNSYDDLFLQEGDTVTYQIGEYKGENRIIKVRWLKQ